LTGKYIPHILQTIKSNVLSIINGRYAFIGAGAVVTKNVPDHALMAGNPAKQIGWMCICGEKLDAGKTCPNCMKKFADLPASE